MRGKCSDPMTYLSEKQWRIVSKLLLFGGMTGFMATFLCLFFLTFYYSATRPHTPRPELGQTVALTWTHPTSYGTAQEEFRLKSLHWWGVPFFLLITLGAAIRMNILHSDS